MDRLVFARLFVCALALAPCGCAVGQLPLTPQLREPPPVFANEPRAGSTLAAGPAGAATVDARAMNDVMAQLRTIGASEPAVQARLMDDMQRTDPSRWPMLLHSYRASLAYRDRAADHLAHAAPPRPMQPATAPSPAKGPPPSADLATLTATPREPGTVTERAPWASITSPAASGQSGQNETQQPVTVVASEPARLTAASSTNPIATMSYQETIAEARPPVAKIDRASFSATGATGDFEASLAAAIQTLELGTSESVKDPTDISRHASLRMLYLAAGRREEALRPIAGLSQPEQDYWSKQIATVATWLDAERIPDPARRAAEAKERLSEAASRLSHLSALVVKNIAFCTEVTSYGVYTRFKDRSFTAGQQVLLYAEVENFKSVETTKGYHTALASSYKITDRDGREVASEGLQAVEEYCQNARRDYFVRYRLHIPKPLANGRYTLQLALEDTLAHKVGQASIDFEILDR